ncbi:putative neural-cadherin 2 isoform X2 [Scylla paramamosain]|uniref:putative neural-cadherin 2 isoform X2 n=1 Tax=Scylla paramamosain TaxID=85552 RepID=UPI0030837A12
MDPGRIFQIITNSTLLATRLLTGEGIGPLEFTEPRYCALMQEDTALGASVVTVLAVHHKGEEVRYSITGGNRDGLFTIDQRSGVITLAAALDYEIHDKHELVVAAEAGGAAVHTIVQVRVADVNDNAPYFLHPEPFFTVIEEDDRDLPSSITTVKAADKDRQDKQGLLYTLSGDGVDGFSPSDAFFSINAHSGELIQQRALDRDPPRGRHVWKVRVQVRDGQAFQSVPGGDVQADPHSSHSRHPRQARRRSQTRETLDTNEGEERRVLEADGKRNTNDEVLKEMPSETFKSPRYELMPGEDKLLIGKIVKDSDARELEAQWTASQFLTRHLNCTGTAINERIQGLQQITSSQTSSSLSGPRKQIGEKTPQNPHPEATTPSHAEREWREPDHSQRAEGSLPGRRHNFQKSSVYNTQEATETKRLSKRKMELVYPQTSDIPWTNEQQLRTKRTAEIKNATESFQSLRGFMHSREPWVNKNNTLGMVRASGQPHLAAQRPVASAAKLCHGNTTLHTKLEQNLNISSNFTGRNFRLQSNQASQTFKKSATKVQATINSERKNIFNISTEEKTTSVEGGEWLQQGVRRKPRSDVDAARGTAETNPQHLPIKSSETEWETFSTTLNLGKNDAEKQGTEKSRQSKTSSENLSSTREGIPSKVNLFLTQEPITEQHDSKTSGVERSLRKRRETREPRKTRDTMLYNTSFDSPYSGEEEHTAGGNGGGCGDMSVFGGNRQDYHASRADWVTRKRTRGGRVHLVETVVTLLVKDINDNPPVFPNTTMFGEVQENGPIDLSVGVIAAWDADDASEGTNAKVIYSIEKNVIHERTGEAIFRVNPQSGLIQTALCCLDRETTPEYHIQVVATDGGGLKGTGTVVVRLADVNDNSPRLARQLWELEVDETWGKGPPNDTTILEVSAADRDTSNYFYYRVVEASGWGWEHFSMRSVGAVGQLYATKTLDYENDTHRRGFKFMVQVTDRGRGGWTDSRHLDAAWVSVKLRDVNDNPPQFHRPHAHVTVREDAAPGTLLAALPAHDPDMGGTQGVEYRVTGGWGTLTVSNNGDVSLWRALDREAPGGAIGVAQIIGVDRGSPPLSATATLTITVTDVNDCAPTLVPPTTLHVAEGSPPTLLGVLAATDHDVWALGHGPPFNLSLAPTNPAHVFSHISLKFDSHLDSGRGGAELWTVAAVDREQYPQLLVVVVVADARGLAATHTVTVIIDDLNDNPMRPAAKTVYLWKTQGGGSDAPLGRIYVNDPDDWDLKDKTFSWMGAPHPLFSLNQEDGTIYASSHVREGRYELQFAVSDSVWGQTGVAANVTVAVRLLTPDALGHAAAVTLTPTTPEHLTQGWTPTGGGGGLGRLVEAVGRIVGDAAHTVEVVSVYSLQHPQRLRSRLETLHSTEEELHSLPPTTTTTPEPTTRPNATELPDASSARPSTCVWLSVREGRDRFMDPVKLQGLLGLHTHVVEDRTGLKVVVEDPAAASGTWSKDFQEQMSPHLPMWDLSGAPDLSSAATSASTTLPLQVVDTNVTALVTPRLTRSLACYAHEPETCTASSCLNGGRCMRTPEGNRCVCPQGSSGPRCKVLGRTFSGSGWAWVRRLPPCLPVTVSLRVLTRRPSGLLLYSGPLAPQPRHPPPTPMLTLQLSQGRVQLLLEGGGEPVKLVVNATLHDGDWHTIHLHLHAQGAMLMVDLCGRGWDDHPKGDAHCLKRAAWHPPPGGESWHMSVPLQLGGLAHSLPRPKDHGWVEAPTMPPLDGCISHLTLNGQLVDLGEPAYSMASRGGCHPQEHACPGGPWVCGYHGECVGGVNRPHCECHSGWSGPSCSTPTVPARLGKNSYLKMALSFTPAPRELNVQLRVRTRGSRSGFLVHLAAHHRSAAFTLHLRAGVACASVSGPGWGTRVACVEGRPLGDGLWHTIRAERRGHNLVLSVDDGDGWRRNESLASFLSDPVTITRPAPLLVDKHDGISVGGIPEFSGVTLITVHDDLHDTCVDDLRVSGRSLPLPPALNGTTWGQITTSERVTHDCHAHDACLNTTCTPPLICTSNWGHATCSCGLGRQLVGQSCKDVDECVWQPCLHSGNCYNLRPGYLCVCAPGYAGDNCQWSSHHSGGHLLTAPAAIAALTVSLLLLVVIGIVISIRLRRHWLGRAVGGRHVEEMEDEGGEMRVVKCSGTDEGGGGEGKTHLETSSLALAHQDTYLECLKYSLSHTQPSSLPPPPPPPPRKPDASETGEGMSSSPCCPAESPAASQPAAVTKPSPDPPLPRDDLRAYAYEGDGSSAGSLASAKSGLPPDLEEEGGIRPLVSEFLEVMDLLKNLPEASKDPTFLNKVHSKASAKSQTNGGTQEPDIQLTTTPTHLRKPRHVPSSPQSREELSTAC